MIVLDVSTFLNFNPDRRCVLSACSKYFRAMFTTDLKEGNTDVVELKDLTERSVVKVCSL